MQGGDSAVRRTSIPVCSTVAELRLTNPTLCAALLLPLEFLSLASVVSTKLQWDVSSARS